MEKYSTRTTGTHMLELQYPCHEHKAYESHTYSDLLHDCCSAACLFCQPCYVTLPRQPISLMYSTQASPALAASGFVCIMNERALCVVSSVLSMRVCHCVEGWSAESLTSLEWGTWLWEIELKCGELSRPSCCSLSDVSGLYQSDCIHYIPWEMAQGLL